MEKHNCIFINATSKYHLNKNTTTRRLLYKIHAAVPSYFVLICFQYCHWRQSSSMSWSTIFERMLSCSRYCVETKMHMMNASNDICRTQGMSSILIHYFCNYCQIICKLNDWRWQTILMNFIWYLILMIWDHNALSNFCHSHI